MPSKVTKWLATFRTTSPESINELCTWMYSNVKLVEDIEEVLEKLTSSTIPDMCQQFVVFYKSPTPSLQHFTIFLLPSLIHAYLSHMCDDDVGKESIKRFTITSAEAQQSSVLGNLNVLESCLLRIGKQFLLCNPLSQSSESKSTESASPCDSLHQLSDSSIFHNSVTTPESATKSTDFVFPAVTQESVFGNRVPVIVHLIRDYADTLVSIDLIDNMYSLIGLHSMAQFCKLCDRIASLSKRPRIPISSLLLNQLLFCADMIIYKLDDLDRRTDSVRRTSLAIRDAVWDAINQIEKRAVYCCLSVPLLISRAIIHNRSAQYARQVRISKSGAFADVSSLLLSANVLPTGQLDSNILATASQTTSPTNVDNQTGRPRAPGASEVITNASFRPETLPEDIPITENSSSDHIHVKQSVLKLGKSRISSDSKPSINTDSSRQRTRSETKLS